MWQLVMTRGFSIFLLLLISPLGVLNSSILVAGYIFCHCDTVECRAAGRQECRAEFYCYTVFEITWSARAVGAASAAAMVVTTDAERQLERANRLVISRGCVANGLLGMCGKRERARAPQSQSTEVVKILSTQCCRDAWCNSDKLFKTQIDLDKDVEMHEEDKRSMANNSVTQTRYHGFANVPSGRSHQSLHSELDATSSYSSSSSFDSRTRDTSIQRRFGSEEEDADSPGRKLDLIYSAEESVEPQQQQTSIYRHQQQQQPEDQQPWVLRNWNALWSRPILIATSIALVLLTFTCLAFFILFTLCRRQRVHQKRVGRRSMNYAGARQTYDAKEHDAQDEYSEPIKPSTTSWSPSAMIYQPTSLVCCCRRSVQNSVYDYCRQESIRPNERSTSDSMLDRVDPDRMRTRLDSGTGSSTKLNNDLRHALIRAPVVPAEQKTSVWIEKQQQQQQQQKAARVHIRPAACSTSQFSASLSPGSSTEFSYPRRLLDLPSPPGTAAHVPTMVMIRPWPVDCASAPDESLEPMTNDVQMWAVYSGPSMDTENSEGRDEQSESTELSSAQVKLPFLTKTQRNTINTGGPQWRVPIYPGTTTSLQKPQQMIECQRQRGTGATSSGGEDSRPGLNELVDWSVRPATQSVSSQSDHSATRKFSVPRSEPNHGATQSVTSPVRTSSRKLIALTNFRKAEDSPPDLVTPYAQFQLSPEPSVFDLH